MTEETKRNKKKWDESEAWFNKEYPDHDDGCLYGKIVVKAAYTAGADSREKRIDELKAQIKVLEQNLEDTEICEKGLKNRIAELEAEVNRLKHKDKTEQEEPYYVIVNMNCQYVICRECPKSGLFKGTYEECENWIKEKLSEVEK